MNEENREEIEKFMNETREISKKNMESIKKELDDMEYNYYENTKSEIPTIIMMFDNEYSSYRLHIYTIANQISINIDLHLKVDNSAYAPLALLVNELNRKSDFAKYYVANNGVFGEYRYLESADKEFDSSRFILYMHKVMETIDEAYTHIYHLAVGKYNVEDKKYLYLMESAVDAMKGSDTSETIDDSQESEWDEEEIERIRTELIADTIDKLQEDEEEDEDEE